MHPLFLKNNCFVLTHFPTVAVVILNWNGKKFLEQFLSSVIASTYPALKIIVADNGSTDDSVAFLKTHYPAVIVLQNKTNEGFAKGYNTALKQVEAAYSILLNSDVEVTPGWIEPVIDLMERNKSIGACQPKIRSWHDKRMFEYAGASGGWIDRFGYAFCRGRVFNVLEEDKGQYEDAGPVFWASGCALFVRTAVYHELNGLDEYFFAHQEEIDLCWRMQLSGHVVFVCPQSTVYHVGGGSLPQGSPRKVFLNYRNSLIMLTKNYTLREKLWKLPARLVLDGISVLPPLLKGDWKYMAAVLKAHFSYYSWLFSKKDRRFFPPGRSASPGGIYQGSVIWQFFIKKRRYFSEIVDNKR
ncbi:MAG: glycosyltransferase family 2 protein [Chitinophagaceae bacterium]|nr:glycosyltransferase family 2 protein [Chitinophagaceae bacterium]